MKKDKNETVCRIIKPSIPMINDKRRFYYMETKEDEDGEKKVVYVLLDNTKGKKKTMEFDSIEELSKFIMK